VRTLRRYRHSRLHIFGRILGLLGRPCSGNVSRCVLFFCFEHSFRPNNVCPGEELSSSPQVPVALKVAGSPQWVTPTTTGLAFVKFVWLFQGAGFNALAAAVPAANLDSNPSKLSRRADGPAITR